MLAISYTFVVGATRQTEVTYKTLPFAEERIKFGAIDDDTLLNLSFKCHKYNGMPNESGPDHQGYFREKLEAFSSAACNGDWDLYVTGLAWHAPWGYSKAARARLNEAAWGMGVGRSILKNENQRYSIYATAFLDSHRNVEAAGGIMWLRYWSFLPEFKAGLGYTAFLTTRVINNQRSILPAVLPVGTVSFKHFELLGTFVPHVSNSIRGDVLMVCVRIAL